MKAASWIGCIREAERVGLAQEAVKKFLEQNPISLSERHLLSKS